MDRKSKLTAGLDLGKQRGLEIGPLDNPIIERASAQIRYVDHVPTDELKAKYKNERDVARIQPVDFVWGEQTLAEAIGEWGPVDYVIASHVIEHVPDPLGWLNEVWLALAPGGLLFLAIPDRRFMYDFARPVSTCGDWLESYFRKHRKPSYKHIFDNYGEVVQLVASEGWAGVPDVEQLTRYHTDDYAMGLVREFQTTGKYVDSHCSVQTPSSLMRIFRRLTLLGLIHFEVERCIPTETNDLEFFVRLRKAPRAVSRIDREKLAARVPAVADSTQPGDAMTAAETLRRELYTVRAELALRVREVEVFENSRSWRFTEPLRRAKTAMGPTVRRLKELLPR